MVDRYVFVAKVRQRESNGESHHDGSELWITYFEDKAFTFTSDETIGAIYDRISRTDGDVIEIKLMYDRASYNPPPATGDDDGIPY
ncbi:hypothetical protein DPM33_23635 [Mesorhizobium hawassense]|uniref:Uncharacterized protein n=1 Tax=Mesorhizobium hawassense TaxID=1209954 RepID=A0A330HKI5_9HYPH|nr:hypothetical protein [Mesorhizobium hawassense]RAZ88520.1 hypothetical protein DPM33_23635 [Mesorhizobium hawassense]